MSSKAPTITGAPGSLEAVRTEGEQAEGSHPPPAARAAATRQRGGRPAGAGLVPPAFPLPLHSAGTDAGR